MTESTRADVERAVRYQLRKWLDGDEAAFLDAMDDAAQYYARRQANRTTISNCERDSRYYSPGGLGTAQANRRYGPLAQATAFYGSSRGGTRNPRRGRRHSLHAGDIAYARVPTGAETCTYCMMLASRGFAYRSEQSAGHADHRGCNCLIVAGVHGSTTVEGVDLAEQYDTWKEMATADARHDAGELSDEEWRAQKRAIVDSHPNATAGIDAAPGREGGHDGERVGWYVPQEYEGYGGSPSVEYLRSSRALGPEAVDAKTFTGLSPSLVNAQTKMLDTLCERMAPITGDMTGKVVIRSAPIAGVANTVGNGNGKYAITLDSQSFADKASFKNKVVADIRSGFYMPASKTGAKNYPAAHEYGHIVQIELLRKENAAYTEDDYDVFADRCKAEILQIVTSEGGAHGDTLSRYANDNPHDFFAECFANMACGKPNIYGRAMETFLGRRGVQ